MGRQDQTIRFNVAVDNDKALLSIADGLQKIADAGGHAAPQAAALLEELKQLATTSAQANGLAGLKAKLTETADAFANARLKVEQYEAQFDAAEAPTAKLTAQLGRARAAVATLGAEFNLQQAAVAKAELSLSAAGVDTENLDAAQRKLQASMAGTRAEAVALASAFTASSAAAKEESASFTEIAEKSAFLRTGLEQIREVLLTFAGFFALEKITESIKELLATGDKFRKFGIDLGNAFGGTEKGAVALEKIKAIAEEVPLSLDQVVAAALKAKREGIDPFNGSLQALIDTNAKFGGNADTLDQLITSLGRAYQRGSINAKEFINLQQLGIPVAKILGEAMGKTSDQILELAKAGELGRESINLLISSLAKDSAGAAKSQLDLLAVGVVKVKDQFEEFLNIIGNSGAYDFVRQKLKDISDAFKKGIGDGSLRETAQKFSDAIVGIGRAIAGSVAFIVDHAAAIKTAAEAWLVYKAVLLGLDLLTATKGMLGLSAATREAGAAAEAAAAETGGFGKLRAKINSIPKAIQIAFVTAGVDFILKQGEDIIENLKKIREVNKEIRDSDDERRSSLTLLALKAADVAEKLKGFANAQIDDAGKLASLNRVQSEQYIASLENATRFYTALRLQAKAIGDEQGVQNASKHLRELVPALDDAKEHLKSLTAGLGEVDAAVGIVVDRFDDLKFKGAAAATAITGAFAHIEIQTPQGLQNVVDIIEQISARSKDAKAAVQTELVGALEKLDGADLAKFQQNVSQRLKEAKGDADALKIALQSGLEAELLQLGLSAEQAGVQFTAAGQKMISAFALIAQNAQASGQQIQLAFAKALSESSTKGEVEALKTRLQGAFDSGRISAAQFQAGTEAAGRKMAELQVAAASAGASLDGMGTAGTTAAQRISAALQDTRDKLVIQANAISRAITDALAKGENADVLRAQFKGVDTELQSLNEQIDNFNQQLDHIPDKADAAAAALERIRIANFNAGKQAEIAAGDASAAADKAEKSYTEWGDAASLVALAAQHITVDTSHAKDAQNDLAQAIAGTRAEFASLSDAAAKTFDTIFKGQFDIGHSNDGSGFDRVARALQDAIDVTNEKIANERTQLRGVIDATNEMASSSSAAFGLTGRLTDAQIQRLVDMDNSIKQGTFDTGLLGQQELGPLQQALDGAIARAEQLKQAAEAATQAFEDSGRALQDALDKAAGNDTAIENRRFQDQLERIRQLAEAAGKLNSDEFRQQLAEAQQLHDFNLKAIQAEHQAKNGGGSGGGGSGNNPAAPSPAGGGSPSAPGGGGSGGSSGGGAGRGGQLIQPQVTVHVNGSVIGTDPATLAEQLTRIIIPEMKKIQARTSGSIFG